MKTALTLAFKNLRNNIGRTILSLLGIVIGVMAIIVVMSLGSGMKAWLVGQMESFGTDMIEIEIKVPNTEQVSAHNVGGQVGGAQITTFKLEDAEEVAELSNLSDWYGGNLGQELVAYKDENKRAMLFGVTAGIADADPSFELEGGEMFSQEDDEDLKQVVVLGSGLKIDLFGDSQAVGKNIKIKDQSYKVIGVHKSRGSTGFFDYDSLAYVPVRTLHKKILGIDYITFAFYRVKDMDKVELTALEMEDVMRDQHDIDDPDDDDFAVMSMTEALEMMDTIFNTVNILLVALTSISLIVGGVGITNVMYVSVTERTFEIGLRKAVGAKRKNVLQQFLFEAIFLTLAGGIIGIIVGFGLAKIAEYVIAQLGFVLSFPLSIGAIALGLIFSAATGLVFGLKPAISASKLSSMEALRKE